MRKRALAAIVIVVACGARTSPLSDHVAPDADPLDPTGEGGGGGGGGSGDGDGTCVRCTTYSECAHCLIQGHEDSYKCPLGASPSSNGCTNLLETFKGDDGKMYTCYYCGQL